MCSASCSASSDSPITTSSIASANSSGKRDMCTPFCDGSRSTVQSTSAATSFSWAPQRSRIALLTPRTPARERPIRTSGADACRSCASGREVISCASVPASPMPDDTDFARLVSLACHDLRTPLATVSGFAKTLSRTGSLGDPGTRYVEMIEAAAAQIAELLDELGIAARIESGRYEPALRDADTLELAQAAAREL